MQRGGGLFWKGMAILVAVVVLGLGAVVYL